jgi:hypothetical protein
VRVTTLTDENLLFRQTYDLDVITDTGTTTIVDNGLVAPSNVGKATIPDYAAPRAAAVTGKTGGGKSYVGQADDSFFLDLRIFDLLYGGDLSEVGDDTLSGYNVNTIALELPKELLVANGDATANPVIGVWSTTSRQKMRVFADTNEGPTTSATDSTDETTDSGDFVQVSRLGNPLVNEAVVPANLKDFFNRSTPDKDGQFLGKVQDPEVPFLIELLYKIPNPNKLDTPPAAKRNDLVAGFLTGFSKDVFAGTTFGGLGAGVVDADLNSLDLNAVNPNPAPAEYLRLNVNVPPTAEPNRLGGRRRRPGWFPERPPADRRRGGHRAAGLRGCADPARGRHQGGCRRSGRRGQQQRPALPEHVPVHRRPALRLGRGVRASQPTG